MRAHLGDYKEPLHRRLPPRAVLLDRAAVSRPSATSVAHERRDETSRSSADLEAGQAALQQGAWQEARALRGALAEEETPTRCWVSAGRRGATRRNRGAGGSRARLPAGAQPRRRSSSGTPGSRARGRLHVLPRPCRGRRLARACEPPPGALAARRRARDAHLPPCELRAQRARPGDGARPDRRGARDARELDYLPARCCSSRSTGSRSSRPAR